MTPPAEKPYRPGAIGALMDELERAVGELARVIAGLTEEEFAAVRVPGEEELRSVQTVVRHVVRAGYGHANYLRIAFAAEGSRPEVPLGSRTESAEQLQAMLTYWEATLDGRWEMTDEEIAAFEIRSGWDTVYDPEQMLEHTIVHVLRHRRQIERFLGISPAGAADMTAAAGR